MNPSTGKKRGRVDGDEDQDDYPLMYRPPPFCHHCGAKYHPDICAPRCPRCDKKHPGTCTAFCRKCAGIGHSWRHCRLFVPEHLWQKQRRGVHTIIENVNITVPVVDPAPAMTSTSLNAAIRTQLETALSGLHSKAGLPMHSRVTMKNLNITTNILADKRAPPVAPDTSLLDRVKRVLTEPRSSIANRTPVPTNSIHTKPAFARPSFARPPFSQPMYSQPVFGQTAFSHATFSRKNAIGMTSAWPV
ncbi:hypothetical protein PENFLA_c015G02099 [Penicillium flavigenum]|uniref:CCHC-type domain-containing protein n=1 Tax=Penicillium flavigenum TaxID=254877 RepID=A0A1V6T4Q2_9EURO|nr:hypothetical protein PENFLA_c015G02099 [Penicillium flavigenum]